MGFEIADLRGVGSDYMGQMVVYLAAGDNPITEGEWATYTPDAGFILNTPRGPKFDLLEVLGSPYQPSGVYTYVTDSQGFTWQSVAAVENRIYPFDADDYSGYTPPLTNSAQAGYVVLTPLPGTIQYNSNDKNHENIYYAEDSGGNPQLQYYVTDPWGNVYILKSVNLANDTPEGTAAAVESAVLPDGWVKSSGYLNKDKSYLPVWSGDVAHANEFRDSADSAWMQIKWGKSGITLATKIGEGLEIWGGNSNDLVKGNGEDNFVHGGGGDDRVRGRQGDDMLTGDDGDDLLNGGAGDDTLLGGAGRDELKGARGKDVFALAELPAEKDEILDFGRGSDRIDLSAIDADAATVEDDPFEFIGRDPFGGEAGELRYRTRAGDAIVKGDTDGDGQADFAVSVVDVQRLQESDFIL